MLLLHIFVNRRHAPALQIQEVVCHVAVLRAQRCHTLDIRRYDGTAPVTVTLCFVPLYPSVTNARLPKMGTKKDGSLLLRSPPKNLCLVQHHSVKNKHTYILSLILSTTSND